MAENHLTEMVKERLGTNFRGEFAITKVILRALEKGIVPSRPILECRYDLVLDDGECRYRAQVKYGGGKSPKQCSGAIQVGLKKWRNDGRLCIPCYTAREIDAVLVYLRQLDKVVWFGPEVFDGRSELFIRTEPAKNNQRKGCLMALDYLW